jgi:hypothetical protein
MHEKVNQITSVSFTKEQAKALQALAKGKDWSIAKTVPYAVDQAVAAAAEQPSAA